MSDRSELVRLNWECPVCGHGPLIRLDRKFAELIGYLVHEYGVRGRAISIRCHKCMAEPHELSLETLARFPPPSPFSIDSSERVADSGDPDPPEPVEADDRG